MKQRKRLSSISRHNHLTARFHLQSMGERDCVRHQHAQSLEILSMPAQSRPCCHHWLAQNEAICSMTMKLAFWWAFLSAASFKNLKVDKVICHRIRLKNLYNAIVVSMDLRFLTTTPRDARTFSRMVHPRFVQSARWSQRSPSSTNSRPYSLLPFRVKWLYSLRF